jgi:hypothetical protein
MGRWIAEKNRAGEFSIEAADMACELRKDKIDCSMGSAHSIGKMLDRLVAQANQLSQLLNRLIGELGRLRPLLRGQAGDAERVNMIGFGPLQLLFGKAPRAEWVELGNLEP